MTRSTFKAYPVADGFYLTMRRGIPSAHAKHFIDGYKGTAFSGRATTTYKQGTASYETQSDSMFYYLRGQSDRADVESGKLRLVSADYVERNSDVYEVVNPYAPKKVRRTLTAEQVEEKARARQASNVYWNLPKIIVVTGIVDYGPCDMGASAICPHCGAEGRYIYTFKCDDGTSRGAMRGCFSKFPRHVFATESQRILDKEADYKKRGWQLPTWDVEMKEAIFMFGDGLITEDEASLRVAAARESRRKYQLRRKGRVA